MLLGGNTCELRTKFRLGGPKGDYIGFWGGPIKGYTTNLVQRARVDSGHLMFLLNMTVEVDGVPMFCAARQNGVSRL